MFPDKVTIYSAPIVVASLVTIAIYQFHYEKNGAGTEIYDCFPKPVFHDSILTSPALAKVKVVTPVNLQLIRRGKKQLIKCHATVFLKAAIV